MRKLQIIALTTMAATLLSGCMATRKFVRGEVKTSGDALSARADKTEGELKETRDSVDLVNQKVAGVDQRVTGVDKKVDGVDQRVTSVDGKVIALDGRTTQGMNSIKGDLSNVNTKADTAVKDVAVLDERFQNRNNYAVAAEKSIQFAFNSATLASKSNEALDEVAAMVAGNSNAIVVLEGRTDSTGDPQYNIQLGGRRVDAVRRYLAVEKEVPIYRIEEISFGAARPIAPNDSREGREQNRSVVLRVLVPSMQEARAASAR